MAQLPPKVPNLSQNWPNFHYPRMGSTGNIEQNWEQNPSWVDEFLNFSSAKRGLHRRSASDSSTFLEAPLVEECHSSTPQPVPGRTSNEFDRFDEERFTSMWPPAMAVAPTPTISSSNPSTSSDNNSSNEERRKKKVVEKNESHEVESSLKSESSQNHSFPTITAPVDRITDPKRVKRILANRQSAQRSRVRKLQYISELERSVTSLHTEVSVLSPRVAFLDHQRLILNVDNSALKQRIAALAQDKIFKDAQQEALKKEIERLRQIYQQQNLNKMENSKASPPASQPQPQADVNASALKEPLLT
ncbi:Basic-leucine zipper domain [Dillenia turbinata]|uniref:Basic-leucine zipper domain n=1 Tax=Dillenia turbinata TaxID=194707 RepID=A0AAN8Z3C2_9MAGN